MQEMVYLLYSLQSAFQVNTEPVPKKEVAQSLREDPTKGPDHLQSKSVWRILQKLKKIIPVTPAGIPVLRIIFCLFKLNWQYFRYSTHFLA